MAFQRNGFIEAARQQGYNDDEISAYLQKRGEKPIGMLQKIVEGPLIPATGAVVGGAGGAIAGIPALGLGAIPGAAAGGAIGAGAGYGAQQSLRGLLGYKDTYANPSENLAGTAKASALGGLAAGGVATLGTGAVATAGLLKKLVDMFTLNPQIERLATERGPLAEKVVMSPEKLNEAGKTAVGYANDPAIAKTTASIWRAMQNKLTPPSGPQGEFTTPNLQRVYDILKTTEAESNAYGGSAEKAKAGEYISKAIRELANSESVNQGVPRVAEINKRLTELYKMAPQAAQITTQAKKALIYGGIGSLLYSLRNQIGGLFGGGK